MLCVSWRRSARHLPLRCAREQVHGALDRDAHHAGAPVDPGVAVEVGRLRGAQRAQVARAGAPAGAAPAAGAALGGGERAGGRAQARLARREEVEEAEHQRGGDDERDGQADAGDDDRPRARRRVCSWPMPAACADAACASSCADSTGSAGSRSGSSGWPRSCRTKSDEPDAADRRARRRRRASAARTAPRENAGATSQNRSTKRMREHDQRDARRGGRALRFRSRDSSSTNGSAKWRNSTSERQPLPAAAHAGQVPGRLLGQVARPDDQELREGEVGPQHDEGEQQLAEVVELLGGDDAARAGSRSTSSSEHRDDEGEGAQHLAADERGCRRWSRTSAARATSPSRSTRTSWSGA